MLLQNKIRGLRYIAIILVLLAIFSCKKQENNMQSDTEEIKRKQDSNLSERIYRFENDEFIQCVKVREINDKSIAFLFISENKNKKLSNTISGVAKLKKDGEIDEDDKGVAYFVNEYIYSTDLCWLSFRIDINTKSLMTIGVADCDTLLNPDCPFDSIDTLKLVR